MAMVPEDIERHLLMNDARLSTYELARAEVVNFLESQHGLKLRDVRIQRETRAANSDAMDVDSFQHKGKSKGKGKNKGKGRGDGGKRGNGKDGNTQPTQAQPAEKAGEFLRHVEDDPSQRVVTKRNKKKNISI